MESTDIKIAPTDQSVQERKMRNSAKLAFFALSDSVTAFFWTPRTFNRPKDQWLMQLPNREGPARHSSFTVVYSTVKMLKLRQLKEPLLEKKALKSDLKKLSWVLHGECTPCLGQVWDQLKFCSGLPIFLQQTRNRSLSTKRLQAAHQARFDPLPDHGLKAIARQLPISVAPVLGHDLGHAVLGAEVLVLGADDVQRGHVQPAA